MRVFNQLVFDDTIVGTTSVYTDPSFNALLGASDQLKLVVISDPVPAACAITVQIEESGDNRNFISKSGTPEINAASLSAISTNVVEGSDAGTTPSGGYVRLRLALSTGSARARIRVYATGRGQFPL